MSTNPHGQREVRGRVWVCAWCLGAMAQPHTCYGTETSPHPGREAREFVPTLAAVEAERDRYWQALTDIAGWENWQAASGPTWREIANAALA